MNRILTSILIISFLTISSHAQKEIEISIGASYVNQAFYTLKTDSYLDMDNDSWDIAFALTTSREAGVHINESVDLSFTGEAKEVNLFKAPTNEFSDPITDTEDLEQLYNPDKSWGQGAFNSVQDPANPFDLGWGVVNPAAGKVEGTTVYVIKLRDDSWKKLMINSFSQGVYNMTYADLDGANEQTVEIDIKQYNDSHLILFSMAQNAVVQNTPKKWDLFFGRYVSLQNLTGTPTQYNVAGVLSAPGVQVAQANTLDVDEVKYDEYKDSLSSVIDEIGSDWKFFDFNDGWIINEEVAYFVKTADNDVYKLVPIEFGGSANGNYVFDLYEINTSSVKNDQTLFSYFSVSPNPTSQNQNTNVLFEWDGTQMKGTIQVTDLSGQRIYLSDINIKRGLNAFEINTDRLNNGVYNMSIVTSKGIVSDRLIVQ